MEKFKQIEGTDYQVSNLGNVKSPSGKILKPGNLPSGYLFLNLGRKRAQYVHRLVATAFIPNPENKKTVNHRNGIKHDNNVQNLEWATQKENNDHAFKNYLISRAGSKNSNAKLTEAKVLKIRASKKSNADIAKEFNISACNVSAIRNRKKWAHV